MPDLKSLLACWPQEEVNKILEKRRNDAISGPGNLVTPGPKNGFERFPFETSGYQHRALIGSLTDKKWWDVLRADPASLVALDPYQASQYRQGGYMAWDAAIGVPGCASRPPKPVKADRVPSVRGTNRYWDKVLVPALGRVGNLGPGGSRIRPEGKYILDLMVHPKGWKILEAAHAMAHRVGAYKTRVRRDNTRYARSPTVFHVQRMLGQLAVCMEYGLPFDTWMIEEGFPGMPDIEQYGIDIVTSSVFRNPTLRIPCMSSESPRLDKNIAMVSVGVFIEPHPSGLEQPGTIWHEINRFSCQPTMVVISGWELVDVLTHGSICANNPDRPNEILAYGVAVNDLQGPDSFPAVLAKAVEHHGEPKFDYKRYWPVEEWLDSKNLQDLIAQTPPLPCVDCMRFNMKSEGAPRRPIGEPPEPRPVSEVKKVLAGKLRVSQEELEWIEWEHKLHKACEIAERAVVFHETYECSGRGELLRSRKARRKAYRERMEQFERLGVVDREIARMIRCGKPSLAEKLKQERLELIKAIQPNDLEGKENDDVVSHQKEHGCVREPEPGEGSEHRA